MMRVKLRDRVRENFSQYFEQRRAAPSPVAAGIFG
jgi:hypothetical protein